MGSVIQATGKTEFENGSRKRVLLAGCSCHCGDCTKPRINSNTLLQCGLVLGVLQLSYRPCQTKLSLFHTSVVLAYSCYVVVLGLNRPRRSGIFVQFPRWVWKRVLPSTQAFYMVTIFLPLRRHPNKQGSRFCLQKLHDFFYDAICFKKSK